MDSSIQAWVQVSPQGGDPWHTDGRLEIAVLAVLSFSPMAATNNPAKP